MNRQRKQIEAYRWRNLDYNGCWNKQFHSEKLGKVCSIAYMVVLWPLWLVSYRESRIVLSSSFESAISIQHVETRNISI